MSFWGNAKVNRTGPANDGKVYINLEFVEEDFRKGNGWYTVEGDHADRYLSVALTALSLNVTVEVCFSKLTVNKDYASIERLYVRGS